MSLLMFDNYGNCYVDVEIDNGLLKYSFMRDYPYLMDGDLVARIISVAENHRKQIIEFDEKYDYHCVAYIEDENDDNPIMIEKYDENVEDYEENFVEFPSGDEKCEIFIVKDDLLDKFKIRFDGNFFAIFEYNETTKHKDTYWEIHVDNKSFFAKLFDEYDIKYSVKNNNNGIGEFVIVKKESVRKLFK